MISVNWKLNRSQLRQFGLIGAVVFAALGAWAFWRHSIFAISLDDGAATATAVTTWTLSGVCALLAVLWPTGLRPLYIALTVVSLPIGFVVSHVIMAIIYYAVLTPIGFVLRILGRDPLQKRFDPSLDTYWIARTKESDLGRYYRQF